jgi:choline-sulfatase
MRILYIDVDSLRADHLSCYGCARPTSPTIDSLASQGVRFNECYASDSPCVPSRAALFSARPGIRNGIVTHEHWPAGCNFRYDNDLRYGPAPTFAHHLARHGYHTVSFTTFADRHHAGWFNFGFRELHVPSLKGGNEDAPEVNAVVLPWLRANAARDDWFVHLNYWDVHTLYTEPIEYMQHMAKYPAPPWPDEAAIRRQQSDLGVRSAATLWGDHPHDGFGKSRVPTMPDRIASRADFEHLINGYDGSILYLDDCLAPVFDELKRAGVWDQTAIILSADHGEAFGELGQYFEHGSVSRAVHRIPLIIRWPGVTDTVAGSARDDLLLHTDLPATVADLLGQPVPPGWTGQSFAAALRSQSLPRREALVWTHGLHTRQRAVYDGRWLFIRTYDPGWHDYPPRMLFDVLSDPNEQTNVSNQHPHRTRAMEDYLLDWERAHVTATGQPDPMRLVQHDPPKPSAAIVGYLHRLARDGRQADAERLRVIRSRSADYTPAALGTP